MVYLYRIASLSKIFPVLMLYKFWEEGKVASLDDPLEKYMENFTIKNPLGKAGDSDLKSKPDGSSNTLERRARTSSVTLRRMASQLSGKEYIHTRHSARFIALIRMCTISNSSRI